MPLVFTNRWILSKSAFARIIILRPGVAEDAWSIDGIFSRGSALSAGYGVFVINLLRARERRAWMEKHLQERKLEHKEIVQAVEGAAIPAADIKRLYDEKRACYRAGRRFTPGELGCALSHVSACQHLLASEWPWALILEDDAFLAAETTKILAAAEAWLAVAEPRVLLLSPLRAYLRRSAKTLVDDYSLVRVHRAWNAHGYALNRAAATLIVLENQPVHLMADDWVGYQKACGLQVLGIDPYCIDVHALAADSQLEAERAQQRKVERTMKFRLRTLGEKIERHVRELLWLKPRYGIAKHVPGRLFQNTKQPPS